MSGSAVAGVSHDQSGRLPAISLRRQSVPGLPAAAAMHAQPEYGEGREPTRVPAVPAGSNGAEHQVNRPPAEPSGTESATGATPISAAPASGLRNPVAGTQQPLIARSLDHCKKTNPTKNQVEFVSNLGRSSRSELLPQSKDPYRACSSSATSGNPPRALDSTLRTPCRASATACLAGILRLRMSCAFAQDILRSG